METGLKSTTTLPVNASIIRYEKPAIEIIEMEPEGILCASDNIPGMPDGGPAW